METNWFPAAAVVTVSMFALTVTYHIGRQSMRMEKLEEWRTELRDELARWRADVNGAMQRIERMIQERK